MAKQGVQEPDSNSNFERIRDKDRPDEAFTTARAVRAGRANAASGRIMVTVPNDHFGPIPPEADPRGLVCTDHGFMTLSHISIALLQCLVLVAHMATGLLSVAFIMT